MKWVSPSSKLPTVDILLRAGRHIREVQEDGMSISVKLARDPTLR